MSEKSTKNAANNMVGLIRELIQQELIKEDNTATCRIMACNSDGSYDINVLPDMVTVIRSVKSISPENLKQGDYAYIFKFKNKLNNAVIIAKIGGLGSDVRFLTAKDKDGNTVNISGGPFLPLIGGTLTGNLDVTPDSTSHKHVKVNAPSGSAYAELSTFTDSSTTRARLTLNDGSGSPTEYRTQEIKIGDYTLSFPVLSANKTIATTDYVSGVNDGTNWTSITINGVTKLIPAGGSADNQRIKAGSTIFGDNDVIDIVAGANISVVGATSGTGAPKITISATDKYHTPTTAGSSGLQIGTGSGGLADLYVQFATYEQAGLVSTDPQAFAGEKTFIDTVHIDAGEGTSKLVIGQNYSLGQLEIWDGDDGSSITLQADPNSGFNNQVLYIPNEATGRTIATREWSDAKYVPYTNATANVDLNGHQLVASALMARSTTSAFDTAAFLPSGITYSRTSGGSLKSVIFNFPDTTGIKTIATQEWVEQQGYVKYNQTVKVGSTTFAAGAEVDFVAGNNVDSIVADTTNNTITINTHDTTYNEATTTTAGLMSAADKNKLNGIAAGAEVNVQSDWNVTDTNSDAFIKNKPSIPTVYLKDASVSNNMLTITKQDNTTVTYNPITEIMTAFDEDVMEAFFDENYPSFIKLVDDGSGNPRFAFDTTNYSVVSGVDDGTNWTSITINGITKVIPNNNDNQTIKGNGTAFGANDAVDILGTSNLVTVTANTTNKTITINLADAYGDTKNPYGTKAANLVLASPNGSTGAPQFRALVAADIPDLSGIYLPRAGGSLYPMTGSLYVKKVTSQSIADSITSDGDIVIHGGGNWHRTYIDGTFVLGNPNATGASFFARDYGSSLLPTNQTYTLPDITGKFIMDAGNQTITGLKTISNSSGLAFTDGHTTSHIIPESYGDGDLVPYESTIRFDAQHVKLAGANYFGDGSVGVHNGMFYANGLSIAYDSSEGHVIFGLDTDSMSEANRGFYFAATDDSGSPRFQPNANGYGLRLPNTSSWSADRTVATISDIGNGTLTIQGNGIAARTFTANQSGNATLNLVGEGAITVTADATNGKITFSAPSVLDTNQKVKAGSVTFSDNDTVNFIGSGIVSVTGDASNDTITISASHQSIKSLDTTATTAQPTNSNEAIAGTDKIILHKVAKTGTYSDLIGKPSIPTKDSDLTNDRYVRFDTASQGLTSTQKDNARGNINAGTPIEIVDLTALA